MNRVKETIFFYFLYKFIEVIDLKDHIITETRRLKNVVIFTQTILSFVLSRQTKIPLSEKHIPNSWF